MSRRRTGQEIEELLESYRTSGMTRIVYCQQVGIALSTLGRYLRQRSGGQRLVRVNLDAATEPRQSFVRQSADNDSHEQSETWGTLPSIGKRRKPIVLWYKVASGASQQRTATASHGA